MAGLGSVVAVTLPPLVEAAFPNGVAHYVAGGLLVGLGTALVYATTGINAGASSFLESTLSAVSDLPRFGRYAPSFTWRAVFTLGIVLGAGAWAFTLGGGPWTTDVPTWRLAVGGVLVGVGTRLGKGCTSGHGVCGVGSGSRTSLVNVATFVAVAVGTAQLVAALGVAP